MKKKTIFLFTAVCLFVLFPGVPDVRAEELPRPGYDNSVVLSMTFALHSEAAAVEVPYMKSRFGKGIYAPLVCSTFVGLNMVWQVNPAAASGNIQTFKNTVDTLVEQAETYGVGLHITLTYGLSRNAAFYDAAKDEDVRNCQWYNDNNFLSRGQYDNVTGSGASGAAGALFNSRWLSDSWSLEGGLRPHHKIDSFKIEPVNTGGEEMESRAGAAGTGSPAHYALATHSRYARKLRRHLHAKVEAAFNYLARVQQQHPDLLLVVSAPGEAEMNTHPVNRYTYLQEYFCDYSPFAVLEFRDWIRHEGLYAAGGEYAGEGYLHGGGRYQGSSGLQHFNSDFNTAFTTWNLKYFHWSLSDPVDTDFSDTANPDPNIIPVSDYTFNSLMPSGGPGFIIGGFDPPRVMKHNGEDDFYDLWHLFRETLVHHYVKDMAAIARHSGFARNHYYTHQIPGDYLFGTRPGDPAIPNLNPRYYSSASPLWTAGAYDDTGVGVTMYDVNFGSWYARTSRYILPEISGMSDNWGVMEYNPEVIPNGFDVPMNTPTAIYDRIMRLYDADARFFSFFKWTDSMEHQFKGNNREEAVKLFYDAVKDKARQSPSTVFTPKKVERFSGYYHGSAGAINLGWSAKIWDDLAHTWDDWGDFKEFVIYRGTAPGFTADGSTEIGRTTAYSYGDTGFNPIGTVYYKIAAVNVNGVTGETVSVAVNPAAVGTPELEISTTWLIFAAANNENAVRTREFTIRNTGGGVLNWTAFIDSDWISLSPTSGINSGIVTVTATITGKTAGTYSGIISVSDPNADNSPLPIAVTLNVLGSGEDAAPFGFFETPTADSTIQSSVPFTGWALDDIEVEDVRIDLKQGNRWDYVGTALFVEGARPDVAAYYPAWPNRTRAGWGYMMLTNFLPGGGSGVYTFRAVATDSSGHETTLGTKTVTVDNANAVNPFGAIDTPVPGVGVSGAGYRNSGWALTPPPNSIPVSGNTIDVFVNGEYQGNPVYNIYRPDVAGLFPGYANADGAHAYFDIDTTRFEDGMHTIHWEVQDTAGNRDGIGSRYFTIRNNREGVRDQGSGVREGEQSLLRSMGEGENLWVESWEIGDRGKSGSAPVLVKTGYDRHAEPMPAYPDHDGIIHLRINELERVALHLTPTTHHSTLLNAPPGRTVGYLKVGNHLEPLPIGSTLDQRRGVFYWSPGPGFVGKYRLVFISMVEKETEKTYRQNITVNILPKH